MDDPRTGSKKGSTKKAGASKRASSKRGAAKSESTATKKASATRSTAKKKIAEVVVEQPAPPQPPPESELDNVKLPTTRGKAVIFGGPKDRGIKPDDKLSLPTGPHFVYERVRSLSPKGFYCAMRFDLRIEHKSPEEGKRWWANKKILVKNPANGNAVIVRAVDIGPHENTGHDIGLSPGAAQALGIEPGAEVEMVFADQKAPTGPVSE